MSEGLMQAATGAGAVAVGLLAWFLPYEWNLFRLKRGFAQLFSDRVNRKIPKVFGGVLMCGGVVILIASALGYQM